MAARAAVYGVLVPAVRFVPPNGSDSKVTSLGRANAAKFVERLCKYPGSLSIISEAEEHILEAHAERLSDDIGHKVTVDDIREGRLSRPKVLDMFAGGGSIPLEAIRLGCDAYAVELNPVAHIIELCTLVYPEQYGKPDANAKGSAKDDSWAGLAAEVKHWGEWVLERVRAGIGDLYPLIPDPEHRGNLQAQADLLDSAKSAVPSGYLVPVSYLWTRTVRCKNTSCGATVPLVRQTWLRKKKGDFVALKLIPPKDPANPIRFEVIRSPTESGLGCDPNVGSKGGNATCPLCGTVANTEYVREEGRSGRMSAELMAVVVTRPGTKGKVYLAADDVRELSPNEDEIRKRIATLCRASGLAVPSEPLPKPGTLGFRVQPYGFKTWGDFFTPRQMLCLLTFAAAIRDAEPAMRALDFERRRAVLTLLAAMLDRLASFSSTQCVWLGVDGERTASTFGRQALPMVWDFSETAPFNEENAGWPMALERIIPAIQTAELSRPATIYRATATQIPLESGSIDAVVTDPPYYDNVPYADISDFFYVWLKRTIGHLYPEHFATELTPKKQEAVAEPTRYGGNKDAAQRAYERMMAEAFL